MLKKKLPQNAPAAARSHLCDGKCGLNAGSISPRRTRARPHTSEHGAPVVLMSPNTLQISNVSTRGERREHVVSLSEQEVLPDIWVHLVTSLENIDRKKKNTHTH